MCRSVNWSLGISVSWPGGGLIHHRVLRVRWPHPCRVRTWLCGQLMLALYRSGRQVDALSVYAEAKQRLDNELGLDPSPELQAF